MYYLLVIGFFLMPNSAYTAETKTDNEKYQSHSYGDPSNTLYCNDLNPQIHIDFDKLYGAWYGAEIITHHETEAYETTYDSCVIVNIRNEMYAQNNDYDYTSYDEKSYDRRQHYDQRKSYGGGNVHDDGINKQKLRLTWDERGRNLEYRLKYENNRRGYWITTGNQKGTMLEMNYHQFTGTIQVMKAVGNHLVLTFCETLPKSQIFTVVLTRTLHNLSRDDIQSIRGLLRRRGLNVQSVRKVCKNSASITSVSFVSIISMIFVLILSQKV